LLADRRARQRQPDGTKRLTLADLQATPITDLVALQPGGTLDATLPLSASLAGFPTLNGLVVMVHEADLFSGAAPDVSLSFALSSQLQTQILAILQKFQNVAQGITGTVLDTRLPLFNKSLDDMIGGVGSHLGDLFALHDAVQSYFNGNPLPTVDGLVQQLTQSVLGKLGTSVQGQLSQGPISLSGGLFPSQDELLFHLVIDGQRALQVPLDLGTAAQNLHLTLDPSAQLNVDAKVKADVTFGIDLSHFLTDPSSISLGDVFFQVHDLEAHASVQANAINVGVKVGFLQAGVRNGSVALNAAVKLGVTDPGTDPGTEPDGKISLAELQSVSSLGSLVTLKLTGTLRVLLPVFASLGSAFSTPSDPAQQPTITTTDADLFHQAPDFQTTNFGNLLDFGNVGPAQVLGILTQLGTYLEQFRSNSLLSVHIPFTNNKTLADVLDVATSFSQTLLDQLQTGGSAGGDPTFATAQVLAD
jgi:hypothetical protein